MICTTIQKKNLEQILEILERDEVEMAEIRLDRCPLTLDEIEELFSTSDTPLVATCRISESSQQEAESKLITAIHAGAAYADLEIEAPPMMSKRIRRETRENGTVLIRSYHDFEGSGNIEVLKALADKCYAIGADIAKIIVTDTEQKGEKVLSLYDYYEPAKLIAFSMGDSASPSRVACLAKGAPFTYASLDDEEAAAPGQLTTTEMHRLVYGGRKFADGKLLRMPSSKSFAQRAIIAAALSDGTSTLRGYSSCGDTDAAISVARALGAEVTVGISYKDGKASKDTSILTIKGIGARQQSLNIRTLHTCESGLLTRLMIPLSAALSDSETRITGEGTLLDRPLKGAKDIMSSFGVQLVSENEDNGQDSSIKVPLTVKGTLIPGQVKISGEDGSQLISGLLMALPFLGKDTEMRIMNPKSIPYLFITMDVLKIFGVKIECEMEGGADFAESQNWNDCTEMVLHIEGRSTYKPVDMNLEGDWSTAAGFLVAGAVFGKADLSGLDTRSLQADLSVMDILMECGASLSQLGDNDPEGIIHVQRAPLNAFEVDAMNCPDLFPVISVLAAFCQGTSRIAGVSRLANKESDRGKAILSMLSQMGVKCRIADDTMIIEGHSLAQRILTGHLLRGGEYTSCHDHRMVMALKIASLGTDSPIKTDDIECVSKSCPAFSELFRDFCGDILTD